MINELLSPDTLAPALQKKLTQLNAALLQLKKIITSSLSSSSKKKHSRLMNTSCNQKTALQSKAYTKIFVLHATASHIVMSFR